GQRLALGEVAEDRHQRPAAELLRHAAQPPADQLVALDRRLEDVDEERPVPPDKPLGLEPLELLLDGGVLGGAAGGVQVVGELAATAAALAEDPAPPAERQKIERLIAAVEGIKDAKFVRNGTEYDGKAAADHMRRKWKRVEKDVHTARDFIRLAATSSIENGK